MPRPDDDASTTGRLLIVVERSGGFAGLTRTWRVEPAPADRSAWFDLVEGCPWNDAAPPRATGGADRFQWRVTVEAAASTRHAELGDDLAPSWRALIDAVRAGRAPAAPGRRTTR
ncbi:protealysin inhibitor emfourin [Microbacterium thalli]|uniref:Uncharacterized protein n=1 Tax=Microbacterium thalli TaxID=3027921 RepID=A0ABT5SJH5_9MICO|nr:protealysin inhibitor emfourin [Microbacterium thalli]MDD7962222.1 hypothetical protein [Microbacterium thalli]MDN8548305.1 hypothetical protein [Microbacterium thalli]